jgi:NADPH:quinone reductase-like Zn-dependent oxidoreductase
VGQLCGIHASSGEECLPDAEEPKLRSSSRCPVAALTVLQALFPAEKGGGMIPGQKVLIHGAAGGVGSFAVQFAKSGGLLVAATCSPNNAAYVRSLGADRVIDYKTEDIVGLPPCRMRWRCSGPADGWSASSQ